MKPFITLLAILLLVTSGCQNSSKSKEGADANQKVASVQVIKPQKKTLAKTTLQPCHIEPCEETPLFAKVEGYVNKSRTIKDKDGKAVKKEIADIGDQVKEGEVLAELLAPEMEVAVQQKEALLQQAKAGVELAAKSVLVAQKAEENMKAKITQAKAGVLRAEGDYKRWQAEHKRITELAADGSVTQQLVDEKLNQLKSAEAAKSEAQAKVVSAQAAFAEAEAHVAKAKADEGISAAREKVAQAELDYSQAMLAYAKIRAPFDGIVTERNVDTGHFVRASQGNAKPLFVVARIDTLRVSVNIPELEAPLVKIGGDALLQVQALGGKDIKGKVTRSAWILDPISRNLRAEIDLTNKDGLLRPGMYATVKITLIERPKVLVLPFKAVVQEKNKTYCCAIESDKVAFKDITLGLRVGDEVEIASGLNGDENVVREYPASLQNGQKVQVVTPKAP